MATSVSNLATEESVKVMAVMKDNVSQYVYIY